MLGKEAGGNHSGRTGLKGVMTPSFWTGSSQGPARHSSGGV